MSKLTNPGFKIPRGIVVVAVFLGASVFAAYCLCFKIVTRHWWPISLVEKLNDPVQIHGWNETGLLGANGKVLELPGMKKLPEKSGALSEVMKNGSVEISRGGRVYGLIRIHHWCGNDPVRSDLQRVDIAAALAFLHEGELTRPLSSAQKKDAVESPGGRFSEHGWNNSEFYQFKGWVQLYEEESGNKVPQTSTSSMSPKP